MKNIDGEFLVNTYKKLLINNEKTKSLLDFLEGKKRFDELMPISIELHLTNRCNLNCEWCVDKQIRKSTETVHLVVKNIMKTNHYKATNMELIFMRCLLTIVII